MILETSEGSQYRLLQRLAGGGCADIFLAETLAATRHHEPYVIAKRPRPGETIALADEARLIASFDHPGIARLLDVAEAPDGPCLILECLHGEDLHDVLVEVMRTGGRLPYGVAIRIAADLAGALQHAHDRAGSDGRPLHVVHRDVSPANVFITYAGEVKLLDFGIARWTGVTQHTHVGIVKGKAPYMSPEQCAAGRLDGRSDLFSLGAMLYELTTLRAPFGSALDDDDAIMQRIVDGGYPAPSTYVPDYPAPLADIIARCLEPVRELRYGSGEELRRDLLDEAAQQGWDTSDAALARWLRGLFGERSPPWLDDPATLQQLAVLPPPERLASAAPPTAPLVTPLGRALTIAAAFALTIALGLAAGWLFLQLYS